MPVPDVKPQLDPLAEARVNRLKVIRDLKATPEAVDAAAKAVDDAAKANTAKLLNDKDWHGDAFVSLISWAASLANGPWGDKFIELRDLLAPNLSLEGKAHAESVAIHSATRTAELRRRDANIEAAAEETRQAAIDNPTGTRAPQPASPAPGVVPARPAAPIQPLGPTHPHA